MQEFVIQDIDNEAKKEQRKVKDEVLYESDRDR